MPDGSVVIPASEITDDLATTGSRTFIITRPPYGSPPGRVNFTASSPDRISDFDSIDVMPLDGPGPVLDVYATPGATSYTITHSTTGTFTYSVDGAAFGAVPASPFTVSRNPVGGAAKILTFKCVRNFQTATLTVSVPAQDVSPSLSLILSTPEANTGASTLALAWTVANMPAGTTYNARYFIDGGSRGTSSGLTGTSTTFTSVTFNGAPGDGLVAVDAVHNGQVITSETYIGTFAV